MQRLRRLAQKDLLVRDSEIPGRAAVTTIEKLPDQARLFAFDCIQDLLRGSERNASVLIIGAHPSFGSFGHPVLQFKRQQILVAAHLLVQKEAKAVEKFFCFLGVAGCVTKHFFARIELPGPLDKMDVANAARSFFNIGLKMVDSAFELGMAAGGELGNICQQLRSVAFEESGQACL